MSLHDYSLLYLLNLKIISGQLVPFKKVHGDGCKLLTKRRYWNHTGKNMLENNKQLAFPDLELKYMISIYTRAAITYDIRNRNWNWNISNISEMNIPPKVWDILMRIVLHFTSYCLDCESIWLMWNKVRNFKVTGYTKVYKIEQYI